MGEGVYHNRGFAQYNDLTVVRSLDDAPTVGAKISSNAYRVLLQAKDANVMWTDDGNVTPPTAANGFILVAGDSPFPYEGDLDKLRFLQAAAGAKLVVSAYS